MSNVDPYTLPPHLDRKATVSVTCRWLREKNATSQPSAQKISSAARPIPRLPPVRITFFPLSPRSMSFHLKIGSLIEPSSRASNQHTRHISQRSPAPYLAIMPVVTRGGWRRVAPHKQRLGLAIWDV